MTEPSTEISQTGTAITVPEAKGRAEIELRAMRSGGALAPIIPQSIEDAFRLAQYVVAAGLAPDSYKNDPKKVVVGLMTALELQVPPLQGLSGIAIINGRPAIWGDLAVALAQKGGMANHEAFYEGEEGADNYTAVYRAWRTGQKNPYEGRFSIGDAKRAKLWANAAKDPWIKYPNRMLMNRARTFALRDGFADCLKGLAIAEEVRDMEPAVISGPVDTAFLSDDAPASETPSDKPTFDPQILED